MMIISEHIDTYYRILQIGDVPGYFEKAEEFLLCTNYGSHGHLEVHDIFIKQFSKEGDVVLVEKIPSKDQIYLKQSSVADFSRKNLILVMWNDQNSFDHSETSITNQMEIDDPNTDLFLPLQLLNSLEKVATVGKRRFLIASAAHLQDPELRAELLKRNMVILQPKEKAAKAVHEFLSAPSGR